MDNELNIVYTLDDLFIPQLGASMTSLIENNKGRKINFYIATDKDEKTNNFKKIINYYNNEKIKINFVDCKKYDSLFEEFKLNKWGSKSFYVYWRLVIFDLIECQNAWYLDADIICLNKIVNPDLKDKTVGCVIDSVHSYYNELIGLSDKFKFYNTGTMFVDVEKWKNNRITKIIIDAIRNNDKNFIMADQDYFSYAIQDYIKTLNPKYNYFVGYDYYGVNKSFKMYRLNNKEFYKECDIEKSKNETIFYHCLDGVFGRPWEEGNESPIKDVYNSFKNRSAYPEFTKKRNKNIIFNIEKKLEILPNKIYITMHEFFIRLYLYLKVKK